mgnify:CR=1 FL=1
MPYGMSDRNFGGLSRADQTKQITWWNALTHEQRQEASGIAGTSSQVSNPATGGVHGPGVTPYYVSAGTQQHVLGEQGFLSADSNTASRQSDIQPIGQQQKPEEPESETVPILPEAPAFVYMQKPGGRPEKVFLSEKEKKEGHTLQQKIDAFTGAGIGWKQVPTPETVPILPETTPEKEPPFEPEPDTTNVTQDNKTNGTQVDQGPPVVDPVTQDDITNLQSITSDPFEPEPDTANGTQDNKVNGGFEDIISLMKLALHSDPPKNGTQDNKVNGTQNGDPAVQSYTNVSDEFTGNIGTTTPGDPGGKGSQQERQTGGLRGHVSTLADEFAKGTSKEARTKAIEERAKRQRMSVARLTGMTGEGESGRATRILGTIGAEEMRQKGALETDIQQERLAGIQAISGAQSSQAQEDINRFALELTQQDQSFDQRTTEAELTGIMRAFGHQDVLNFEASMNSSSGDESYQERWDFDRDGKIDAEDYKEMARIAKGSAVQTLQGKLVQRQIKSSQFNDAVTKAGITGLYDGKQTVQDVQRKYENRITESQIFVDSPPVATTMGDLNEAMNSKIGDPNYRLDFDYDGNGVIDSDDIKQIVNDPNSELSGDATDPNSMVMFNKPGKITVIARKLGLDEFTVREGARQFDATIGQKNKEFLIKTSGYIYGDDGLPTHDENGKPLTTFEREKFENDISEFNKTFIEAQTQFAENMKLSRAQLKAGYVGDAANIFNTIMEGVFTYAGIKKKASDVVKGVVGDTVRKAINAVTDSSKFTEDQLSNIMDIGRNEGFDALKTTAAREAFSRNMIKEEGVHAWGKMVNKLPADGAPAGLAPATFSSIAQFYGASLAFMGLVELVFPDRHLRDAAETHKWVVEQWESLSPENRKAEKLAQFSEAAMNLREATNYAFDALVKAGKHDIDPEDKEFEKRLFFALNLQPYGSKDPEKAAMRVIASFEPGQEDPGLTSALIGDVDEEMARRYGETDLSLHGDPYAGSRGETGFVYKS